MKRLAKAVHGILRYWRDGISGLFWTLLENPGVFTVFLAWALGMTAFIWLLNRGGK